MRMFRFHREFFEDSMATLVLLNTKAELVALLRRANYGNVSESDVTIEPYGGIDRRNGWNTHLVSLRGNAVGMLDGAFES